MNPNYEFWRVVVVLALLALAYVVGRAIPRFRMGRRHRLLVTDCVSGRFVKWAIVSTYSLLFYWIIIAQIYPDVVQSCADLMSEGDGYGWPSVLANVWTMAFAGIYVVTACYLCHLGYWGRRRKMVRMCPVLSRRLYVEVLNDILRVNPQEPLNETFRKAKERRRANLWGGLLSIGLLFRTLWERRRANRRGDLRKHSGESEQWSLAGHGVRSRGVVWPDAKRRWPEYDSSPVTFLSRRDS